MDVERREEVIVIVGQHVDLLCVFQHFIDVISRHIYYDVSDSHFEQFFECGPIFARHYRKLSDDYAFLPQLWVL